VLGLGAPGHGLAFRNVVSESVAEGGDGHLFVEGEIVSRLDRELPLPSLAFSVRDADHRVIATWSQASPRQTLGAGEAVRFRAHLKSPPVDGEEIEVRFAASEPGGTGRREP
jgi:hypothetical protein